MNLLVPILNLTTELTATHTTNESTSSSFQLPNNSLYNDNYSSNNNNNNSSSLFAVNTSFLEQSNYTNTTNIGIFDNYYTNNSNSSNNNIITNENAFNDLISNISTIVYDFGKQLVTTVIDANNDDADTNAYKNATTPADINTMSTAPPQPPTVLHTLAEFQNTINNNNSKSYRNQFDTHNVSASSTMNQQWLMLNGTTTATMSSSSSSSSPSHAVGGGDVEEQIEGTVLDLATMLNVKNANTNGDSWLPNTHTIYSNFDIDDEDEDDDFDDELERCHPNNTNFNCSQSDFVKFILGPQTLPLYKALLFTIIFGGIFITSMLGNILVCIVIIRHPTMHTATNYYLFSLAVSDLIYLLFGLPAEIFLYWHQYPYLFGLPFCKIRAFISEASTYVSVLTIVAFSMERFLAICHPLHLYAMSGFKRAVRIIALLWIVSLIAAIPFGLLTDINYLEYPLTDTRIPESAFCSMIHYPDKFPLFEVSFCVFFVVPMLVIFILYGKMGAQIRFSTTLQLGVQRCSMHRESRHQQSRKAVIRMLAAVVVTFFICWLPFHLQRLWFLYAKEHSNFQEINEWIFSIAGFTYYVSCTINPILYNVMSHRYRVAFKDVLSGKRRSVYYSNGLARDQSSFRETTIASTLGVGANNGNYDRVHSVRVRSMHHVNNIRDRNSIKAKTQLWTKDLDYKVPLNKDLTENGKKFGTNVVVVVDNGGINGRPKVYTENEAGTALMNKNNETSI